MTLTSPARQTRKHGTRSPRKAAAIALFLLLLACGVSAEIITANTTIPDATIYEGNSGANYGLLAVLNASANSTSGFEENMLFKFDLAQYAGMSAIHNATLFIYLYGGADDSSSLSVNFYNATGDTWDESSVTWDSAPGTSGPLLATLSLESPAVARYYAANLTSAFQTELASGNNITSIRVNTSVSGGTYSNRSFYSRERAYLTPYLVLNVSGTSACGTLTQNRSLISDINTTATCFNITAHNVTLDCRGHMVRYANTSAGLGVNVTHANNISVINCNFKESNAKSNAHAIWFTNTNNSNFSNNNATLTGSSTSAIYGFVSRSENATISSNRLNSTGNVINFVWDVKFATIANNTIWTNASGVSGILLSTRADNNTIYNNSIFSKSKAISVTGSNGTYIHNNNVSPNGTSIELSSSFYNTIVNNSLFSSMYITVSGTTSLDVIVTSGFNTIHNNTIVVFSASGNGIRVLSANNNTLSNNTINSTRECGRGIYITAGNHTNVTSNNITVNGSSCVGIAHEGVSFFSNIAGNTVNASVLTDLLVEAGESNVFANNAFMSTGNASVEFRRTTNNFFLNNTYNSSKFYWNSAYGNSNASFQWYVRVNVTNQSWAPLGAAFVNITNSTNPDVPQHSALETAGGTGLTAWVVVTQFTGNNTVNISYTPHNFTAWKGSANVSSRNSSINSSQTLPLMLDAQPVSTLTEDLIYSNCGILYYKLRLFSHAGAAYTETQSVILNLTDASGSVNESHNATVTGGVLTSALALPNAATNGVWALKAHADALSEMNFSITGPRSECIACPPLANNKWRITLSLNNSKVSYDRLGEAINVSISVYDLFGNGLPSLGHSSGPGDPGFVFFNDTTQFTPAIVDQGFGHYYFLYNASNSTPSNAHNLTVSVNSNDSTRFDASLGYYVQ